MAALEVAAQQVAALSGALHAPTAAMAGLIAAVVARAAAAGLVDAAADLERIRSACARLQALVERCAQAPRLAREHADRWHADRAHLRHDLRTPLNAVKGYGDMLLEDWRDDAQDALLSDLQRVLAVADDLLAVIDAAPPGV